MGCPIYWRLIFLANFKKQIRFKKLARINGNFTRPGSMSAKNNGASMPYVPLNCKQSYHLFYFLMPDLDGRSHLIEHLKSLPSAQVFHYMPLHKSNMAENIKQDKQYTPFPKTSATEYCVCHSTQTSMYLTNSGLFQ